MLSIFRIILCTAFFFTVVKVEAQESINTERPFSVSVGYVKGLERIKLFDAITQKHNQHGAYVGFRYDNPFKNGMISYGTGATVLLLNETAYVQIPLQARLKIHDILTVQTGPSFNFRPDQIGDDMDLNISVSTGININVSPRFYVDVQYNHQLNDYYRNDNLIIGDIDFRMHVLTTGIGYKF